MGGCAVWRLNVVAKPFKALGFGCFVDESRVDWGTVHCLKQVFSILSKLNTLSCWDIIQAKGWIAKNRSCFGSKIGSFEINLRCKVVESEKLSKVVGTDGCRRPKGLGEGRESKSQIALRF